MIDVDDEAKRAGVLVRGEVPEEARARQREQRRLYFEAAKKYQTALRRASMVDPRLYARIARCLLSAHAYVGALAQADKAATFYRDSVRLQFYRGSALMGLRRFGAAHDAFDMAVQLATTGIETGTGILGGKGSNAAQGGPEAARALPGGGADQVQARGRAHAPGRDRGAAPGPAAAGD